MPVVSVLGKSQLILTVDVFLIYFHYSFSMVYSSLYPRETGMCRTYQWKIHWKILCIIIQFWLLILEV